VSGGLKRILLTCLALARSFAPSATVALALGVAAAAGGCARGPDAETRRQTATLAEALRPAFFAEALRRVGGARFHGTARFAAGLETPDDGVTTTTDVWLDRAGNYRVLETNDRDGGREIVLLGRELFVALRYGKMIRRVAEEPEPTNLLEEALGAPWAAWEVVRPYAAIERGAATLVGGAKATEYRLARATARTEDPAAQAAAKGLRAWRAGVVVSDLAGRAVVDDATGALVQVDLAGKFTTKRDGRDLKGALDVHGVLSDVASTGPVARPASEDLALRQRIAPEQRELLGGLPTTRPAPAPSPARGPGQRAAARPALAPAAKAKAP
jgi:hypothetical protein